MGTKYFVGYSNHFKAFGNNLFKFDNCIHAHTHGTILRMPPGSEVYKVCGEPIDHLIHDVIMDRYLKGDIEWSFIPESLLYKKHG